MQYSDKALKAAIDLSEKNIFAYKKSIQTKSIKDNQNKSFKEFVEKNTNKLSKGQIDLLLQLDEILDNKFDLKSILRELERVSVKTKKSLTNKDAQIILVTVEVAKNSCIYWDENMNKWIKTLTGNEPIETKAGWFSWGNVGKADALGAAGGAVGAAFVNAIPGAGQVSYVGAIVGGASGNSAINALEQVWGRYL